MPEHLTAPVEELLGGLLKSSLLGFRDRFNANPRVKKLIKSWDRHILIEATDTGAAFTLVVKDLAISGLEDGSRGAAMAEASRIHLQADEDTQTEIFSGRYNPATALLDGVLAVYCSERDKVKLEALAMVLWGM